MNNTNISIKTIQKLTNLAIKPKLCMLKNM